MAHARKMKTISKDIIFMGKITLLKLTDEGADLSDKSNAAVSASQLPVFLLQRTARFI
jgi:hypothetical protein